MGHMRVRPDLCLVNIPDRVPRVVPLEEKDAHLSLVRLINTYEDLTFVAG